ncbi:MAG: sulfatase-like hydrolase/transferase [Lentisphaeria bacterium]|nr:sulfatase-like hydrolase/transferase [Lentisphaeria bacterium]
MARQPNMIVFFTDQQRWDTTGVHGNPMGLTPNFDRIACEGTHVYNSFTCQPVCGPARSCLQTGMYATNTGSVTNGIPLNPDLATMAQVFGGGGYQTGYIGKWHLGPGRGGAVAPEHRGGYDYWLASNVLEFTSNAYQTEMYDNDGKAVQLPGYRVDALTDAAIRYIDGHAEEPFFLFLSYIEPHFQNHNDDYPPPIGYREAYTSGWIPPDLQALGGTTHQHIAGYYGMCKRLDEALGRLLDTLISLRLDEDTIVLFTSDHGCHFKTRNSEYKRSCHESSIRVPTALCGPGFEGGGRIRELVSLVDLPPTLLDAAGLAIPEQMEGRSILPLTRGENEAWPAEAFVQISESQCARCIRTERWKYSVDAPGETGNSAGAGRYVEEFLYDLQSDPYELCNLVASAAHRQVRADLRERLLARMAEASEPSAVIEPAAEAPSGQRHAGDDIDGRYSAYTEFPEPR